MAHNIHTPEQEEINRQKYGSKEDDLIARSYRDSKEKGDIWCSNNTIKYLTRFTGNSIKSNNIVDLRKAADYLNRMLEQNEKIIATLKQNEITE
jgi:hypothetical protein